MVDQTEVKGIDSEARANQTAIYAGKRIYTALVTLQAEIKSARQNKVKDAELGVFAELDTEALIAAAREVGKVPVWNAEGTPQGRKLTYPKGTTGVNQ